MLGLQEYQFNVLEAAELQLINIMGVSCFGL